MIALFTSETIQNSPAIKPTLGKIFDPIISAQTIGFHKTNPEAYHHIAKILNIQPNEMLFVDDSLKNIQAAAKIGCETHHYENADSLNKILQKLQAH